mgnify:FL=1
MEQVTPLSQNVAQASENELGEKHHTKNIYPAVRHALLIACILCALFIIIFLMYQNGKSIYDNGI